MNAKAQALGMNDSRFVDPTGLSSANVSSARDLARMVAAAHEYPLIRQYSTRESATVQAFGRPLDYRNTNGLVRSAHWEIGLSKTGYISEAGRCLVMRVRMASREVIVVLLDSWGKLSRVGDANRIKKWLESQRRRRAARLGGPSVSGSTAPADSFREDVIAGLSLPQKVLPPKYFYDARGSRLFEAICRLKEYYPTRCELALTRAHLGAIARFAGRGCALIEYGSGESRKSRLLIEALRPAAYVPVDISAARAAPRGGEAAAPLSLARHPPGARRFLAAAEDPGGAGPRPARGLFSRARPSAT